MTPQLPLSSARHSLAVPAALLPRQHRRWQSWLSLMPTRVPPGTWPTPLIAAVSMLRVQPPFAWMCLLILVALHLRARVCLVLRKAGRGWLSPPSEA